MDHVNAIQKLDLRDVCIHCASHNHVDRMSCLIVVSVIRVISIPRSP